MASPGSSFLEGPLTQEGCSWEGAPDNTLGKLWQVQPTPVVMVLLQGSPAQAWPQPCWSTSWCSIPMPMNILGLPDTDSPHQASSWCTFMGGLHSALMSPTNCFPGSWSKCLGGINDLLSYLQCKNPMLFVVLLHTVVWWDWIYHENWQKCSLATFLHLSAVLAHQGGPRQLKASKRDAHLQVGLESRSREPQTCQPYLEAEEC